MAATAAAENFEAPSEVEKFNPITFRPSRHYEKEGRDRVAREEQHR
jgi:hypothetical protein